MVRTARPVRKVRSATAPAPSKTAPAKAPTARARKPKTVTAAPEAAPDKPVRPKKQPVEGDGYAGFRAGSGAEIAAKALVEGGKSRTDIMRHLRENYPTESKNWSVTISTVATALLEKGYTDEGYYRMIPPAGTNGAPKKVAPVRKARPPRKLVATGSGQDAPVRTIPRAVPKVVAKAPVVRRPRARNTPSS